ncbi:MAG TPA: hypothetical protein VMI35_13430 [Puia sp.]|nr:hypothetical protein [Puia sp.]
MHFDPDNHVVKLCARGMELEASQDPQKAGDLFMQAWEDAKNDFEKFIAAHYVARHQKTIGDKLSWDKTALHFAQKIGDEGMAAYYPSLYLNIAHCYEQLGDRGNAEKNYQNALLYKDCLPDDGYGRMIKSGIERGLARLTTW